nr:immunoglobulin light chain junction region [Macaca mulatta]MOW16023.1 immunoglobulin light chain junction region [Macaca mulatta]MOW16469.1 immunoglobulin light chain junction region [Macaca mulatta]MOW17452.1 immunoglobulin light chain junction region [Macaca mulatta]MOW17753.1 immunoglobulin light chain junction region [Macaca mulatta]
DYYCSSYTTSSTFVF